MQAQLLLSPLHPQLRPAVTRASPKGYIPELQLARRLLEQLAQEKQHPAQFAPVLVHLVLVHSSLLFILSTCPRHLYCSGSAAESGQAWGTVAWRPISASYFCSHSQLCVSVRVSVSVTVSCSRRASSRLQRYRPPQPRASQRQP